MKKIAVVVLGTVAALLAVLPAGPARAGIKPGLYTASQLAVCHYGADGRLASITVASAKVAMEKKFARRGTPYQWVGWSATLQGLKAGSWQPVAAHPGRGGYPIDVRAKAFHKVDLPSAADRSAATFSGYELGTGYASYRVVVTLKWYAPANPKRIRGKVTRVVPHYNAAGGSASYLLPGSSSSGCIAALPANGTISVVNTTDAGQTAPDALVAGTLTSTWPIPQPVTAYLLGPVATSSGVCPSDQSLDNADWTGTVTVPAHGSYKFAERPVTSAGYYWWYVTGAGSSSCSAGVQVLPPQATAADPVVVTLTNPSSEPVGSDATATVSTAGGSVPTLTLLGPATSAGAACASTTSTPVPLTAVGSTYVGVERPMDVAGYYAFKASNGSDTACSDAFQVTKVTPKVTWTSTPPKATLPTLVTGKYSTKGYGSYAGKLTLYKAFTKGTATCTPVAGKVSTVGSFAVTGNVSNAVLQPTAAMQTALKTSGPGWFRWGFTSAGNAANNAVTTPQCSPIIAGEFAGVKMSVSVPDGPFATGSTHDATIHFDTSGIASTNSKRLENGDYTIYLRMYRGSTADNVTCTGTPKVTRQVNVSTLANPVTIPMSVKAADAGFYKFTVTWAPAGGAQIDVGGVGCGNLRRWK